MVFQILSWSSKLILSVMCSIFTVAVWCCALRIWWKRRIFYPLSLYFIVVIIASITQTSMSTATILVSLHDINNVNGKWFYIGFTVAWLICSTNISICVMFTGLDIHCYLTDKNLWQIRFKNKKQLTLTYLAVLILSIVAAFSYIFTQDCYLKEIFTISFRGSVLYVFVFIVVFDMIPNMITLFSAMKIIKSFRKNRLLCKHDVDAHRELIKKNLTKSFVITSVLYVISSTPWSIYQTLNGLLLTQDNVTFELSLFIIRTYVVELLPIIYCLTYNSKTNLLCLKSHEQNATAEVVLDHSRYNNTCFTED